MPTLSDYATDADAQALQSLPDGWLCVVACGWWFASRACDVCSSEFDPLGPFLTAGEAVDSIRSRLIKQGEY